MVNRDKFVLHSLNRTITLNDKDKQNMFYFTGERLNKTRFREETVTSIQRSGNMRNASKKYFKTQNKYVHAFDLYSNISICLVFRL